MILNSQVSYYSGTYFEKVISSYAKEIDNCCRTLAGFVDKKFLDPNTEIDYVTNQMKTLGYSIGILSSQNTLTSRPILIKDLKEIVCGFDVTVNTISGVIQIDILERS